MYVCIIAIIAILAVCLAWTSSYFDLLKNPQYTYYNILQSSGVGGKLNCKIQGIEIPLDVVTVYSNDTYLLNMSKIHLNGDTNSLKLNNVECDLVWGKTAPGQSSVDVYVKDQ